MDNPSDNARRHKLFNVIGWVVAIIGMLLWGYGFLVEGSAPVINWSGFLPQWAADFVPNLEAELGMVLSTIAMVPIYYVQYKEIYVEKDRDE